MTEDNLKELIKMQKKKYEIISKAEELQKVIDIMVRGCNCVISVSDYTLDMDAKVAIGRCDNGYIDEDDALKDIIEALKLVKDKYIKAFEELGTEAKKGEDNGR